MTATIGMTVWRFEDAPEEYQKLSTNGGDEDWLVLIPAQIVDKIFYYEDMPYWMEKMGCCSVDKYPLENGDIVVIGAHG